MGLDAGKMMIYMEEMERHGVARPPDQGITQVGPLIMRFGTQAQKEHYLPRTLSGEYIWCQGYSEPNAGSDLAGLQTAAVLDGDHFVVNGQKIWTSLADDATHMYLLVRTDKSAKKQQGISFLLVDLKTPGITLRPIRNLAGHEEFCQVFFDNVRVPREKLVGELNDGWTVAKALLGFERLGIGSPRRPQYALNRLEAIARAKGLLRRSGLRRPLHRAEARHRGRRGALRPLRGAGEARRAARPGRVHAQDLDHGNVAAADRAPDRGRRGAGRRRRRARRRRRGSRLPRIPSTMRVPPRSTAARARSSATSSQDTC